ncbi:hypothetical protein SERLA73DRAFT_79281 [Serpula lacrymans var. lacrymans S7.3]|uniref:Uncharacterized protein n=1 Tax=Serpula lacrymans var. lacrymans (strain S7.3) TaxID=936435 RepID=F8QFX3_SERL3|nr:hypothetical protein SERLA73DRAFT_79281 [Serpula lacrymans var. lacrymans S7.3]
MPSTSHTSFITFTGLLPPSHLSVLVIHSSLSSPTASILNLPKLKPKNMRVHKVHSVDSMTAVPPMKQLPDPHDLPQKKLKGVKIYSARSGRVAYHQYTKYTVEKDGALQPDHLFVKVLGPLSETLLSAISTSTMVMAPQIPECADNLPSEVDLSILNIPPQCTRTAGVGPTALYHLLWLTCCNVA